MEKKMSESILTYAEQLINGDRAAAYGSPLDQYTKTAALWNAYLGINFITPEDAVNMMILLKVQRNGKDGYHEDSVVDIAGYAGVAEKLHYEKSFAEVPQRFVMGYQEVDPDYKEGDE
jgi:Domain of unknown function (DUF6378)